MQRGVDQARGRSGLALALAGTAAIGMACGAPDAPTPDPSATGASPGASARLRSSRADGSGPPERIADDSSLPEPARADAVAPEPIGRWERARSRPLSAKERAERERLRAIGYLRGYEAASGPVGVVRHDRSRAQPGLNLYVSGHGPEAILMDMDGEVLHRWRRAFDDIWPDREPLRGHKAAHYYRRAALLPDGELLAIIGSYGLVKLDRHSRIVWTYDERAHHDLQVLPDGRIVTLTRKVKRRPEINRRLPVVEDFAVVLSPHGRELVQVSLLNALQRARPELEEHWDAMPRRGDLLHANSVQWLEGRMADTLPAFEAGNLLVSFRETSSVAVLDLEERRLVWAHRGPWRWQHHPRVLDEQRLLVFDNVAAQEESAVLEFDVAREEVVDVVYRGSPEEPFFTGLLGAAHRLPNGNTLIVESDEGRAFEVAPDGEIVWDFRSPHRTGPEGELVAALPDLVRITLDGPLEWLDGAATDSGRGEAAGDE